MFRLGVVVEPEPEHERYRGWVSIPYLDLGGMPLTIRFRCPLQHDHRQLGHGKYMTLPDEPSRVFNVSAILGAENDLHVTEGEFDAIVLNQCGYHAVALPGASNWKPHYRRLMHGFSRVYVWGDPDQAGAEFNRKVMGALHRARPVRLKEGDITETYLRHGHSGLRALIEGTI